MPYAYNPLLDDENDPNNPPQLAGAGQVVGGAAQTQPGGLPAGKPTSSDRFQNLNDYLTANQGGGFGGQFVGKVQGEVDNANTVQGQSGQQYRNMADQGSVTQDKALVDRAIGDPAGFTAEPNIDFGKEVTTGPVKPGTPPSFNQDKVKAFNAQRDATYKGPTSYGDVGDAYGSAYSATKKATDTTRAAQSEGGRFALLDNYFGRPSYNQGEKSLDNLLVQRDPTTQTGIAQAAKNAETANANFAQQETDLSNYGAGKKAETEAARKYSRDALGIDDSGNLVTDDDPSNDGAVQKELAGMDVGLAGRKTELARLKAYQKGFKPIQNIDSVFGITPQSYMSSIDESQLNRGNTASVNQAARLRGLEQLAGISTPLVGNSGDAGTYTKDNMGKFNKAGYIGDIESKFNSLAKKKTVNQSELNEKLARVRDHEKRGTHPGELVALWEEVNQMRNQNRLNEEWDRSDDSLTRLKTGKW